MANFAFTWNVTFESQPADVEDASLGALRIRNLKSAVSERLKIDHSWAGDGNDGKHSKVTLPVQTGDPVLDVNDVALYAKQNQGLTELFFQDNNQNVLQITASGKLNTETFGTGTKMMFAQAAAPSGWTLSAALHDRVLRVVDGTNDTGGVSGGAWAISGLSNTFQVLGHALTIAEIPPHDHGGTFNSHGPSNVGSNGNGQFGNTDMTGGGAAHTHGLSGNVTHDGSWRPAYTNVIICVKN